MFDTYDANWRRLATIFALFLVFALGRPAQAAQPLDLKESIEQATNQSLVVKRAQLALEAARANERLTRRSDDPALSLDAAWGNRWREEVSPATGSREQKIHTYGATLSYKLFEFGRQAASERQALRAMQAEELSKEEVDESVFWSVVRLYYALVSAERMAGITREQLQINESKLAEQRRNYRQGLRPESDVVTAEVDVGRTRIAYEQATDAARLARLELKQALNLNAQNDRDFRFNTGGTSTRDPEDWQRFLQSLDGGQTSTAQRRLVLEQQAASAELDVVARKKWPTLSAGVGQEWATVGEAWQPLRATASAQLQLSWDVPWNGMNRSEVEKVAVKKRDLEMQQALDAQNRQEVEERVKMQLAAARALHASLKAQVGLVSRQRVLVQQRYVTGKATALELSTAEAALLTVKQEQARLSQTVTAALIDVAEVRGVRQVEKLASL